MISDGLVLWRLKNKLGRLSSGACPMNPIQKLWSRIEELENQGRFSGEPYPSCITKFPYHLTGRGFFPGGDGIWRDLDHISEPATLPFPQKGVMILGQDFGTLDKYPLRSRPYELNSLLIWKYIVPRLCNADIQLDICFFTNGLLGLKKEGSNDGKNPGLLDHRFLEMCQEFLQYQIEVQDPKLVIIFDSLDQRVYSPICNRKKYLSQNPRIFTSVACGTERVFVLTQHPRSDCGVINKNKQNYNDRCKTLSQGWLLSISG